VACADSDFSSDCHRCFQGVVTLVTLLQIGFSNQAAYRCVDTTSTYLDIPGSVWPRQICMLMTEVCWIAMLESETQRRKTLGLPNAARAVNSEFIVQRLLTCMYLSQLVSAGAWEQLPLYQATICERGREMEVQQTRSEGSVRKQDSSRAGGFQDLGHAVCEIIVIVHAQAWRMGYGLKTL